MSESPPLAAVLVSLLALGAASGTPAQDPAPGVAPEAGEEEPRTFETGIEQVIVDAVIIDKEGNPVPGITKTDLVVLEDGVRQEVVSFEAVRLPDEPGAAPPPPPRVSTNAGVATQRGRVFVIVFDDLNLTVERSNQAKAAVASFLTTGVREGDYVTLISTGGGAWWTERMEAGREPLIEIVKRLEGRRVPDITPEHITDWEAMRIHIYSDELVIGQVLRRYENLGVQRLTSSDSSALLAGTTADPVLGTRASMQYFQARARNQATLQVLERALNSLTGVQGRKSVILVSEGFIDDPNLEEFRRVDAASRRANAAVYFVNAQGLAGMPMEFTAQFGPAPVAKDVGFAFSTLGMTDDGAEGIAEDSGGFTVKNTNDLDAGIRRISRESQIYYLIGYNPTNTARDGKFRKIEVELADGKGLKVRARKGYYAPTADGRSALEGKLGSDPVIQAALDSPWAEDGIPLRMTHYVGAERLLGKAQVVLVTEVDIRDLDFRAEDDREVAELEVLLVVAHRETGEFYRYDQDITLSLRPSTRARLNLFWFPIERDFDLEAGGHEAKIIVRQKGTDVVGSVIHRFEVPPLQGFRASTPILSDLPRPDPVTRVLEPQPLARREFHQGGKLACQLEVFGAEKDETGMPRVAQGYVIRGPDGSVFKRLAERFINPTSIGAVQRLFTVSLEYATPGPYEMLLTFRDEVSGKVLELREPFTVVAPPTASSDTPEGPGTPSS
jgi:VWFA-related protein